MDLKTYIDKINGKPFQAFDLSTQLSHLHRDFKAFYAFSKSQMDEKIQPGIRYASCPDGLLVPLDSFEQFDKKRCELIKNAKKSYLSNNTIEAIVLDCFRGFECFYCYESYDRAIDELKEFGICKSVADRIYRDNYNAIIEIIA